MSKYSFYFKEIFPTYEVWRDTMATYLTGYEDFTLEELNYDRFVYNILYRHYGNVSIRYSEPSAFISELLVVYEDRRQRFVREQQILQDIYALTPKDFELAQRILSNLANNPNTAPEDPTVPLSYIGAQTYNMTSSNKLNAYLDALNKMPSLRIYNLLQAKEKWEVGFSDLFVNVQAPEYNIYKKDGN